MSKFATFSLLLVVALDVMGQGVVIPVITTLLLDEKETFLPQDTPENTRQTYFGIAMGAFFFSWFLGAAYIAKLSDFIGRKQGILICLSGAFLGYVLLIVSLYLNSFPILVASRILTGFTAGNQPIAQAALVDASTSESQKTKFMGLILVAVSVGLVLGPSLGGVLSDHSILGKFASEQLPFYGAGALILSNILLIILFFHNLNFERRPVTIKITDVFLTLYHAAKRPVVRKLSIVFFCSQLALNSFFVFLNNYLLRRFNFDTLQNSIVLIIFGVVMALASAFLVTPFTNRFTKKQVVSGSILTMTAGLILFLANPIPNLAYLSIVPFVAAFGVNYPVMLTFFSLSVSEKEQGWVMGVTVALYTLGAGLVSLLGGSLMALSIRIPFYIAIGSLILATLLVSLLWRTPDFDDQSPS
ncbi:MAG: MFS transporter [Verrucomicrobiota bacterium]